MKMMKLIVLVLLVPGLMACTGTGTSRTHDHHTTKGHSSTMVVEEDDKDCADGGDASGSESCEKSEPIHDHRDMK